MINRLILLFLGISLISVAPARSQQTAKQSVATTVSAENASSFDPAAADTGVVEDRAAREASQSRTRTLKAVIWLILWNFLLAVAISIFLLASRISARMRDFAETQVALQDDSGIALCDSLFRGRLCLELPAEPVRELLPEHQYGFATQGFIPWFRDQLIALGLTLILGTILLIVLYAVSGAPAHMVDLGNSCGGRFLMRGHLYRLPVWSDASVHFKDLFYWNFIGSGHRQNRIPDLRIANGL